MASPDITEEFTPLPSRRFGLVMSACVLLRDIHLTNRSGRPALLGTCEFSRVSFVESAWPQAALSRSHPFGRQKGSGFGFRYREASFLFWGGEGGGKGSGFGFRCREALILFLGGGVGFMMEFLTYLGLESRMVSPDIMQLRRS